MYLAFPISVQILKNAAQTPSQGQISAASWLQSKLYEYM